jgi:transposase
MKISRCKLSKKDQHKLLEFFVLQVTARSAADVLGVQANTAALFYHKIRQVIWARLELQAEEILGGEIELDESYFGGHRKGKRGRGAAGKVIVFGILKRDDRVFTKVVADTKANTLMPIILNKIAPDSVVYTDSYRSYNALDVSGFHHHRINHSILSTISTASRTSGIRQNASCVNITASPNNTSTCLSKSASLDLIMDHQNSS